MEDNKRSNNKYFDWLIHEAQKRHSGETFTLSHDRARLVPSYASIDQQQQQIPPPIAKHTNNLDASNTTTAVETKPLFKNPSFSSKEQTATVPLVPKEQVSHDKEWAEAMAMTYGDETPANKVMGSSKSPRRSSSSSLPQKIHKKKPSPQSSSSSSSSYSFSSVLMGMTYVFFVLYTCWIVIGPVLLEYIWDQSMWCPSVQQQQQQQQSSLPQGLVQHSTLNFRRIKSSGDHRHPPSMVYFNDPEEGEENMQQQQQDTSPYDNPDYNTNNCQYERLPLLFYLTLEEADLCTRLLVAVFMGALIGYERRSTDRPAGIRTMGLVSLGSCFFTISSEVAFKSSPMSWDASRVTAAIPSGVGFLGAGLIWKGTTIQGQGKGGEVHQVHGLTTAASVWLSAAVGCGAGGRLYFASMYAMVLVMIILRYGPKLYLYDEYNHGEEPMGEDQESDASSRRSNSIDSWQDGTYKQENTSNIRYVLYPKFREANP